MKSSNIFVSGILYALLKGRRRNIPECTWNYSRVNKMHQTDGHKTHPIYELPTLLTGDRPSTETMRHQSDPSWYLHILNVDKLPGDIEMDSGSTTVRRLRRDHLHWWRCNSVSVWDRFRARMAQVCFSLYLQNMNIIPNRIKLHQRYVLW